MKQIVDLVLNLPAWVWITIVAHLLVLGTVAYLILLERKVASWVQDRIGPNRVGLGFGIIPGLKDKHMYGLGQPLADGLKFIVKEDYQPKGVDRILFTLAPIIMIITVIISIAVVPWGGMKETTKKISYDYTRETVGEAAKREMPNSATLVKADNVNRQSGSFLETADITYRWPFQIASLNIGVLFILATLSLAV